MQVASRAVGGTAPLAPRLLALVPGGIGDQILFFPALASLRQRFPEAELEVLVEPRAAAAYEVCPSVSRVLTFPFKEQLSLGDLSDLLGRIRERQYDGVLSLGRSLGVKLLLWLTGIPKRVGYAPPGPGRPWLTDPVPLKPAQYAAQMYHDLVQGFGIAAPAGLPQIRLKKADLEWAEQERKRLLGDAAQDYVLLHPGASQLSQEKGIQKIYPSANWVKVIKGFREQRPELPLVLVVGPEDEQLAEGFLAQLPELPVSRPVRLGQLAALIGGATLLLCADSAPMHLAVAVQTPLVALFGPTDPLRLLPSEGPFRAVKGADGKVESIAPEQILQVIFPA
ncbi:glycosyltransferase family 9 protein [Synechococcus sp. R6-7]|jgi:ADP-heptose:LPS heptosyltransferase|uniref:glycosyltransferase family 9 protein n=3 Tax=unclassified Synechococcus TaxID=2626047 RepID=UPI0039C04411